MTGNGNGSGRVISRRSTLHSTNNAEMMVVRALHQCSRLHISCEFCENLERCCQQYDFGITKYTDREEYWGKRFSEETAGKFLLEMQAVGCVI